MEYCAFVAASIYLLISCGFVLVVSFKFFLDIVLNLNPMYLKRMKTFCWDECLSGLCLTFFRSYNSNISIYLFFAYVLGKYLFSFMWWQISCFYHDQICTCFEGVWFRTCNVLDSFFFAWYNLLLSLALQICKLFS